ncbi:MAG TPA: glycosyltransferase family A protein [Gaiellaceae bacterium]
MTRVAVVVPCFNDGETLPQTLASLEGQEPHELVVVDDGSDDARTLSVLGRLADEGIRVVRRENGGLSAARTTGVEETEAPYVMPLDADDELLPGALAVLADALDAAPQSGLAWGDIEVWGDVEARLEVAPSLDPWLLTYVNTVPVASMIRRSALIEVGGWRMGSGYEDWDLWLALAERGFTGVRVPAPTFRYRRRPGRMLDDCTPRHAELYAQLRSRHSPLFERRRQTRRSSTAPRRAKLLFPLVDAAPFDPFTRHRLFLLVNRPRQILDLRRRRRIARRSAAVASG